MLFLCGLLLFYWIPAVVLQDLKFTIEPKSVIVRKGSPVILNCQTNIQTTDVVITWKKGYTTLWIYDYRNKPYQLLSNHSLYFPSVDAGDEDVYFCGAHHGSTTKVITSKVPAHITLAYITTTFITSPLPTEIREHNTATLTCVSGASQPLPSVTWEKNGQPITDETIMAQHYLRNQNATSATLELKNLSILVDTGYYRCVAINPLLPDEPKRSRQAFLKVLPTNDEPRMEVHPLNTISPRRYPARLDCIIVGNPSPLVFWLHNGVRVVNTSDRIVYPNGSLAFSSLALEDRGQYSCNGTNSKGTVASTDVFLSVAYIEFQFKRNPENQTAVNGSRLEMICESPDHFPINAIKYSWYKAFKRITLNSRVRISSGNLVISPVVKSDEGVYFCEASLSKEFLMKTRASRPAYLTINVPPYFLTKPSDRTVVLRQTLRLSCKATGFPKPSLTWSRDYALLHNTSRLTLGADGGLVLNRVEMNDEGQYRCETQNVAGNNVAVATVTVHAPPNGTVMPNDTRKILGRNATFMCRFAGNPPPITIWYFKRANERAVLLAKNSSRYIQNHERLDVLNITETDNGLFICVGENIVGIQNFSASLVVLVPARFEIFPRNTTVNESDVAEMTCGGYGNPTPNVTWSVNGRVLSIDSRITVVGGKLSIKNVRRNDTGIYSCTVENNIRRLEYPVYLTVQVSPGIREITGPSRVRWKHNVTFSCKTDGFPTPRIMWYKDMRKIPYTSRIYKQGNELRIVSAENNDTGNYTCEASNVVGSIEMTRQLIVEVSPSEPLIVRFGDITSTSLQIFWHSGFDGYSTISSFKLEIRRNSSRTWNTVSKKIKSENYTVHGLKPYTVYHLRVFARNKIGWSGPSRSVWNRTAEDAPSSPNRLQCKTMSSSTIQLTWDKPSQTNGELRKYRIQYSNHSNHANVSTSSTRYSVSGLRPFTWYRFRVQAATGKKSEFLWGNYSSYVSCRSGQAAPVVAPRILTVTPTGPHSILARWQAIPIGSENGVVLGYYIQYKKKTALDINYTKIFIGGNDSLQYNIAGLAPWTEYHIRITAVTVRRGPWSSPRTSRTMESVPSEPPINVVLNAMTSSSLSVHWDPPLLKSQNGVIRGYTVLYSVADSTGMRWNVTTNKTRIKLSGLLIFTSYVVQVRAFTDVGFGPYSIGIVKKTLESYPSSVVGLSKNITRNSVILSWQPPHIPNGIIIAYTTFLNTTTVRIFRPPGTNITMYNVTSRSREITTSVTQVVLSGFYGNVTYSVCVAARTSVGYGPCSRNLVFTTNFTKKVITENEEFTSSIIDDHLPLIAGGTAVLLVLLIALFVCCFIRRRNRKKEEKETQQTFNFQRSTFPMRSFDDGESSYASHGSNPIHASSVDSSSIHSRTNPSNVYATPEGHDGSPLVLLRNNSLALGSDASSYDAPYSSIDEIGVDPAAVAPVYTVPQSPGATPPRTFVNALYTERELEDTMGETGSLDSHVQYNPIYQPNYAQIPRLESEASPFENFQEGVDDFPEGEGPLDVNDYAVLILPPPPLEYSDFGEDIEFPSERNDETLHAYSNAATDF